MAVIWYTRWEGENQGLHFYRLKGSLTWYESNWPLMTLYVIHRGGMDCNKAKCYSRDQDSYPCPHGHILHTLTNWANSPPLLFWCHRCQSIELACRYKSSFPKRNKCRFKTWIPNVNAKFRDCVLGKSSPHKYVNIYIHIWKACFQSTIRIDIWIKYSLEWRLSRFGKELFMYKTASACR